MRTSRISNALIVTLLSSILSFGGFLYAEKKEKPEATAKKAQADSDRSQRKKLSPPTREERRQPVRPHQPAGNPVTFLGVASEPVNPAVRAQLNLPAGTGIAVGDILKDSPAEKAGIKQFDVLTMLDDQILVSGEQLQTLVRMKKPGDQLTLTLLRAANERTVRVKLESHLLPARATVPRNFPGAPWDRRFGPPGRWDRDPWEHDWKKFGDEWSKDMEEWLEKHSRDWTEGARKFLEESLGDPETWEPKIKKWLEEEVQPQIETHVRSFANVHATIVDEDGKVEITMKEGKKHATATDPDGKVVFEGFCETDAERKKVPKNILKKIDSVKVDVKIHGFDDLKKNLKKPPVKPAPKGAGGKKEDAV